MSYRWEYESAFDTALKRKEVRPLLGKEEISKVTDLGDVLQELDQDETFACSGSIAPSEWNAEASLIYFKGKDSDGGQNEGGEYRSTPLPLSQEAAKDIYLAGKPSPFGHGHETIFDETYRQAREIKPPFFALTSDILARTSLMSLLAVKLNYGCPLVARLSKLNAYGEGGFFKPHRDTPRGKNHIGTLVFCLPSAFTGGELVIHHNGTDITFDWAEGSKDTLSWGFLYSDCEHEVLPVKSGMRVTIAYDIFTSEADAIKGELDPIRDSRLELLVDSFKELLDPSFLPEGGDLAIGLMHSYATVSKNVGDELARNLKSGDALTLEAVRRLGLRSSFIAAFNGIDDSRSYDFRFNNQMKLTHQYCFQRDPTFKASTLISEDFFAVDGGSSFDGDWLGPNGLDTSGLLIWVIKPIHFTVKNTYTAMGNDAGEPENIYAGAVLVVTLPPAHERGSKVDDTPKTKEVSDTPKNEDVGDTPKTRDTY
ncbi:hypothetical protein IAT38_007527 [Cryptococcus sp. DSM 104549]